jgi:DNA polymerase III alpha subunit (gram-positive type)
MKKEKNDLKRKLKNLQNQINNIGVVARGSIVELNMKKGKKKYPANYFSTTINKKTKLYYLGKKRLEKAKEYHNNYLKLRELIDEITVVSMELLKLKK